MLRNAAQYRPEVLEIAAREAARRGLSLEPLPPEPAPEQPKGHVYYAAGRLVTCPHCSGRRYLQRRVALNAHPVMFEADWLTPEAFALLCLGCHRLEWFSHVESRLEEE